MSVHSIVLVGSFISELYDGSTQVTSEITGTIDLTQYPDLNEVVITKNFVKPVVLSGRTIHIQHYNLLTTLDVSTIPNTTHLTIMDCPLETITGEFSRNIEYLHIERCRIKSIPFIPDNIKELYISDCLLENIINLPSGLTHFQCSKNRLTSLPPLPDSLVMFQCYHNYLTSVPTGFDNDDDNVYQNKHYNTIINNINIDNNNNAECPVCCGHKETIVLHCNHTVCFECFCDWFIGAKNNTCPMCRRSFIDA